LKITKANTISSRDDYNVKEGLRYFPDDYFELMFPLGVEEDLEEEANNWYLDYIELMDYRRNAAYGRTKYFHCLLSPDTEESALFIGINKVIAKSLQDENNNTDNSNEKDNSSNSYSIARAIYPCKVLNRYECPYQKCKQTEDAKFDVDNLFALQNLAFQVELAFATAYSMSKSNEIIYETDFDAGKVKEIRTNYYGNPEYSELDYLLEEKLPQVQRLSKVPIRNVQEVYDALIDRETLDKVLKQGLDEEYLKYKDQFADLFVRMKDKINIEDLHISEPIWKSNRQKSKCSMCNEFANILCVNCNLWICVDHWRQHKTKNHASSITS
jgi:hypothetical protein